MSDEFNKEIMDEQDGGYNRVVPVDIVHEMKTSFIDDLG